MRLVSILVSANATAGSSGAASPTAASVRASRRKMLFPDADNRTDEGYVFPVSFMMNGMAFSLQGQRWRPVAEPLTEPRFATHCNHEGNRRSLSQYRHLS